MLNGFFNSFVSNTFTPETKTKVENNIFIAFGRGNGFSVELQFLIELK